MHLTTHLPRNASAKLTVAIVLVWVHCQAIAVTILVIILFISKLCAKRTIFNLMDTMSVGEM